MPNGKRALELMDLIQQARGHAIWVEIDVLSWSTYAFQKNFHELRSLVEHLQSADSSDLWVLRNRDRLEHAQREVGRRLHNFVASALSLVDHTRNASRKFYADDSARKAEYQRRVDETFVSDPLSQFIKGLRQYCLHYRPPFVGWQMRGTDAGGMEQSFFLNRALLHQMEWNATARLFIDATDDQINFLEAIDHYHDKIEDFYIWFEDDVRDLHAEAFTEVKALEDELAMIELEDSLSFWDSGVEKDVSEDIRISNLFAQHLSTKAHEQLDAEPDPRKKIELAIRLVERHRQIPGQLKEKLRALYPR